MPQPESRLEPGGALLVPGVGLPLFIAMGVLFGALNGGLSGLITHREKRY
ncbi:MAG: hypothetical protein ACYDA0_07500 [Candidatus Dormibacteraceae bacterium]